MVKTMTQPEFEYWLCGECLAVNRSDMWGGTDSTAICPTCDFEHRGDESSWIEAGTELEMYAKRAKEMNRHD